MRRYGGASPWLVRRSDPIRQRLLKRLKHPTTLAFSNGLSLAKPGAQNVAPSLRTAAETARDAGPETGLWIEPIACATGSRYTPSLIALDNYLTVVDETGRIVHSSKRGAITAHLEAILGRLNLDLDTWTDLMCNAGSFLGGAFGHLAARAGLWMSRVGCIASLS